MTKPIGILAILSISMAAAVHSGEPSWTVDEAHTRVGFSVKHFGINTVNGSFTQFKAQVEADSEGKLRSVRATVAAKSINTGNQKRDEHLRAPDLFDVTRFPEIKVAANQISWKGNQLSGTASMTIKGKTRKVRFTGTLEGTKTVTQNGKQVMRAGYRVRATIDRSQFGITFGGMTEGLGMVGEEVTIVLDVETTRPL